MQPQTLSAPPPEAVPLRDTREVADATDTTRSFTDFLLLRSGGEARDRVDITDRPNPTDRPPTGEPSSPDTTDTTDTTDSSQTTETTDSGTTVPSSTAPEQSSEADGSAKAPDLVEQRAVWPRPSSDVRFTDPVAAARSFALYYARFDDPVIGEFQAADSHSGEVPVRPNANGPETVVRVGRSQHGEWFVTGSGTADITVGEPTPGGTLGCPMATSGTALAFEGTVQVRIDAYQPDGDRVEMGRGFVTGSGTPPAGPFSDRIACTPRSGVEDFGIVAFWTDDASGELDGPTQIVTIPVRLPR